MMNKMLTKTFKKSLSNHLNINSYQISKIKATILSLPLKGFATSSSTRKINGPFNENNLKGYINYFRKNSHKYASIDPLIINSKKQSNGFSPEYWGLSELEKIEDFPLDESSTYTDEITNNLTTVQDLESFLKKLYLSNVGVEFEYLNNEEEKLWLYQNYENIMSQDISHIELQNAFKGLYPATV